MRQYDEQERVKYYVFEIPFAGLFRTDDGRIFQKGNKKIKRYECKELKTGKKFVIQPHALVEWFKIYKFYEEREWIAPLSLIYFNNSYSKAG